MNLETIRFRLLLLPCLFVYLITDRNFKGLLLVPPLWIALDLIESWVKGKFEFDRRLGFSLIAYLFVVAYSIASGSIFGHEKILPRDVFVIGSAIALFLFPKGNLRAPQWLFTCFGAAYAFMLKQRGFSLSQFMEMFATNIFLPSTTLSENDWGIVFGLFTVHFFVMKSWPLFAVSAVTSMMVSKRALVVSVILSLLWWLFVGRANRIGEAFKSFTLFLIYGGLMVFSLFLTELGSFALKLFGLEHLNVGRFLMGRNNLVMSLRSKLDLSSLTTFFGHGPGSADTYLAFNGENVGWGAINGEPFNPHNDYMKIVFDYGFVGYLVFFAILLGFYGGTSRGKALMVYTITAFCFDNSLIFIFFHIAAGFLCSEYMRLERNERKTHA